jgi:hypothetical protein
MERKKEEEEKKEKSLLLLLLLILLILLCLCLKNLKKRKITVLITNKTDIDIRNVYVDNCFIPIIKPNETKQCEVEKDIFRINTIDWRTDFIVNIENGIKVASYLTGIEVKALAQEVKITIKSIPAEEIIIQESKLRYGFGCIGNMFSESNLRYSFGSLGSIILAESNLRYGFGSFGSIVVYESKVKYGFGSSSV